MIELPPGLFQRILTHLTHREVLIRLGFALCLAVILCILIHGWSPPFAYRNGYVPSSDIVASVPFKKLDQDATEEMREAAKKRAPLVYRQNPESIVQLRAALRNSLLELAAAKDLPSVRPELWQKFTPPQPEVPQGPQPTPTSPPTPSVTPAPPTSVETDQKTAAVPTTEPSSIEAEQIASPPTDATASPPAEMISEEPPVVPSEKSSEKPAETLPEKPPEKSPEEKQQELFAKFQSQISGDENLAQIDGVVDEVLRPYEKNGLIEKPPTEGNQKEIFVYPTDRPRDMELIPLSQVLLGDGATIRDELATKLGQGDLAKRLFAWLQPKLVTINTLTLDEDRTRDSRQKAADEVPEVFVNYERGQILAKAGTPLDMRELELLKLEYRALLENRTRWQRILRTFGMLVILLVLITFCAYHLKLRGSEIIGRIRSLAATTAMVILTVATAEWAARDPWHAEIVPVLIFGQIVAIAYKRELAMVLTGFVTLVVLLGLGLGLGELLILLGATAAAIFQLDTIRNRSKLILVGIGSGLVASLLTLAVGLVDNQPIGWPLISEIARNAGLPIAAGFLMTGLLPMIEKSFGVLTDISLLELGDVAHPLLQELVRRAPSTYNHSITLGSIAEAAADAIGARGLLVRVGAYFHDIGKMLKPGYYIENQGDEQSRHQGLVPAMSSLVIIAHIKDGANLARQHRLPEPIIDFILQHHGTTLVGYFYQQASKMSEANPEGGKVDESTFRYPGPKPQTKEAAVLMLADAVESASRTLVGPTPARIESLVRELADRRLEDGQFDESGLTLRELRTIEESMVKSITAIYHGRVKYPDQKTE